MPSRLLSAEWIAAVNALEARVVATVRLDLSILDVEHPEAPRTATFDTSTGRLIVTLASDPTADVHVATDSVTALAIVRSTDTATALDAFLAGRILVQGGVMPLIALGHEVVGGELAGRIREITG